jgi:uncharacterized protein YkwD
VLIRRLAAASVAGLIAIVLTLTPTGRAPAKVSLEAASRPSAPAVRVVSTSGDEPTVVPTTTPPPPPPPEPVPAPEPQPAPAPPRATSSAPSSPSPAPAPAPPPPPPPAPVALPQDAARLVALVNDYRARNGLGPLAVAGDATAKAQAHAEDMAADGSISHSSNLGSGIDGWTALAENVGSGGSVAIVHDAFCRSSAHASNMLGPYGEIGVGVAQGGDGNVYVTEIFVAR